MGERLRLPTEIVCAAMNLLTIKGGGLGEHLGGLGRLDARI